MKGLNFAGYYYVWKAVMFIPCQIYYEDVWHIASKEPKQNA
jgi:hypothetical protein